MNAVNEISFLYKYNFSIDFNLENAWKILNNTCPYAQIPLEDFLKLVEFEMSHDDQRISNFRMYIDTFHHKSQKSFMEKWVEILLAIILHNSERKNIDTSLAQIVRETIFSKYNYQFLLNYISLECYKIPFDLNNLYVELKGLGGIDFRDVSQNDFSLAYRSNFQDISSELAWGCKELLAYFLFASLEQPLEKLSQVYCTMIVLHNEVSGIDDINDSVISGNVYNIFNNNNNIYMLLERYGFYVDVLMYRHNRNRRHSSGVI